CDRDNAAREISWIPDIEDAELESRNVLLDGSVVFGGLQVVLEFDLVFDNRNSRPALPDIRLQYDWETKALLLQKLDCAAHLRVRTAEDRESRHCSLNTAQ